MFPSTSTPSDRASRVSACARVRRCIFAALLGALACDVAEPGLSDGNADTVEATSEFAEDHKPPIDGLDDGAPSPPEQEPEQKLDTQSEVLWWDCRSSDIDRTCEQDKRLILWVPGEHEGWRVSFNGRPLSAQRSDPILGGTRITIAWDRPAHATGTVQVQDPSGATRLRLRLEPDPRALDGYDWSEEVKRTLKVRKQDPPTARALARTLTEPSVMATKSPGEQLARQYYARRLVWDGKDTPESVALHQRYVNALAALAQQQNHRGFACEAAQLGLFIAIMTWDEVAADRWAAFEPQCATLGPRDRAAFEYYLLRLELRRQNYTAAIARGRRLFPLARRVGISAFLDKRWIEPLVALGRWSEARASIKQWERESLAPCPEARRNSWVGTFRVMARQRGADLGDPAPALRDAQSFFSSNPKCGNAAAQERHARIKLGYAAALRIDDNKKANLDTREDIEKLKIWLKDIDPADLTGKYPSQYHELRAIEAIATDTPARARDALAAMAAALAPKFEPEASWRHAMLEARLAELEQDPARQRAAYRRAEAVLERLGGGLRSGALRSRWLSTYRSSAIALVEHLIEHGDIEGAACAARTARTRALAAHNASARRAIGAPLPDDSPRATECNLDSAARRPDEWVLMPFPREDKTWWWFSIADGQVQVRSSPKPALPPLDDDAVAFWDPWSPLLEQYERVRVLPTEQSFEFPFHQLHWGDTPLARTHPVVYGLDLPRLDVLDQAERRPTDLALVAFADISRTYGLVPYRPAVAEVEAALAEDGWASQWTEGPHLVRDTLTDQLEGTAVFHYFGHGDREPLAASEARSTYEAPPIPDDDQSDNIGTTALLLHDDTRLRVDDVLALRTPPKDAVLMGCLVGYPDRRGWDGGMNLVHAFLLAGTEHVLANSSTLDAAAAAKIGPYLYDGAAPDDLDLSAALARLWSANDEPNPGWQDLRVWSR